MTPQRLRRDEQGSIVIWGLGLAMILLFFGGLAFDVWRVISQHATINAIADRAAIAATTQIDPDSLYTGDPALVTDAAIAAAEDSAQSQPGWQSSMTVTVAVDVATDTVTVTVTDTVEITLLKILLEPEGIDINAFGSSSLRVGTP